MGDLLQICLMLVLTAILVLIGVIVVSPHLIIPMMVKIAIFISPFKKKWILLDNNMWCSYLEKGDAQSSSESILLIHGFSGSAVDFMKYASKLGKRDHIISINLLNHGDTASLMRDIDIKELLQFLRQFVEKSTLQQRSLHIVGYSMGGLISTLYASKYPDSIASLILISPAGMETVPDSPLFESGKISYSSNKSLADSINHMSNGTMQIPPSLILTALRHHKNRTSVREGYVLKGIKKFGKVDSSVLEKLGSTKVMYIQGDEDKVTLKKGMDYFLKYVPHSECNLISKGSHFIVYTHTDDICNLINKWFGKIDDDYIQ